MIRRRLRTWAHSPGASVTSLPPDPLELVGPVGVLVLPARRRQGIGHAPHRHVPALQQERQHALALHVGETEALGDLLDRLVRAGVQLHAGGAAHLLDRLLDRALGQHVAGGVPELQEERLVRQLAGVVGEVFRGQIVAQAAADMVLAALVVGHRHAVQAHQPQRVERHFQRALADLRVGDAEPELHDVTPAYLELQLRQHRGHVELALRELALLDLDVGMLVERRQRRLDQVAVVQRPELVGEDRPGLAGERADQPRVRGPWPRASG